MPLCSACRHELASSPSHENVARVARTVRAASHLKFFTARDHWNYRTSDTTWECTVDAGRTGRLEFVLDVEHLYVTIFIGPGYQTWAGTEPASYEYEAVFWHDDHSTPGVKEIVRHALYMLYGLHLAATQYVPLIDRPRDMKGRFIR